MSPFQSISSFRKFVEIDIWRVKISTLPRSKAFLYQQIRIWIIALAEFKKDKIVDKASALTYFSLLSIVPVIAMAFGIAKGFGLEDRLEKELDVLLFGGQEEVLSQVLEFSKRMLIEADGGIISGISFVFLLYAVLRLMYNIEMAFNDIWDTKTRTWQRKVSDYIAIVLLGPVFVILSSSATVFVTSAMQSLTSEFEVLGLIRPAIFFALRFTPFVIISCLLILLYLIFPNTRVKFWPAFIAAVMAGVAFQLTQWGWINGQVYLTRYNTIYGTFAALPLFMIYLQLSWLIVLFGAEFAYATQNANVWEYRNTEMQMSTSHRKKVTLLIMRHIVKNFQLGNKAMTISELSLVIQIPYRFIKDILREVESVGLVTRLMDEEHERYQPGIDIDRLDIFTIFRKLEYKGFNDLKSGEDELFEEIEGLLEEIEQGIKDNPANKLLKNL
ncbi:MAG: membrane protein [Cyclobacteriaceae bacterium]|jgi:membrane protein